MVKLNIVNMNQFLNIVNNSAGTVRLLYPDGRKEPLNHQYTLQRSRSRRDTRLWIRTPLIPGATATKENIEEIGRFVRKELADVIERWELCAFNHVCKEKYTKIGKEWDYDKTELMEEKEVQKLAEAAGKYADGYLAVSGLTKKQGAASAVPNGK